jgi:hypothetical protein
VFEEWASAEIIRKQRKSCEDWYNIPFHDVMDQLHQLRCEYYIATSTDWEVSVALVVCLTYYIGCHTGQLHRRRLSQLTERRAAKCRFFRKFRLEFNITAVYSLSFTSH